ncbi:MAG: transposase [Anaerolineales bacterium]|nr:transposase [Anaerolineales bacterium]
MKYDPQLHHRRSIRLQGYDYTAAGAYFITICSYQREHIFGEVVDGEMRLNALGEIARAEWFRTAELRPQVELHEDEFVVMPNHAHGIIWLVEPVGARRRRAPTEKFGKPVVGSIPTIVRAYKSAVTYAINKSQNSRGSVIWQRNYYEHVIRDERELDLIARYIHYNPFNWQVDCDNPENTRKLPAPESVEDYLRDAEEILGVKIK